MRNATFWNFARRLLRRRRLATGTLVFSVLSAAGLAAGLVAIGPLLELILARGDDSNLRTAVAQKLADLPWLAALVPTAFVEILPTDRFAGVACVIGALCVLTVLGALANFAHQYCSLTLSMVTVAEIRLEVFRHALRLPLGNVVRRGPADLVTRVVRDTAELERGFSALTSKALAQVTKGIAAFAAAVWFDWRLTIVASASRASASVARTARSCARIAACALRARSRARLSRRSRSSRSRASRCSRRTRSSRAACSSSASCSRSARSASRAEACVR